MHALRATLALALLLVAAGCTTAYRAPELGGIYNRAAQHHAPDRNPIIVIPGVLGSRLEQSESGRVVWGAFGGGYAKPSQPEGLRLIALPMREGAPLAELTDDVVATDVLDRIQIKMLGMPLQLKAYFQILSVLGAGGYRDEALGLGGAIDYGPGHFTCFQFPYDWRRDNVENARRLHQFILEKQAYVRERYREELGVEPEQIRFDIVAHSMGALLLRYYLRYGAADLPADGSPPELTWAGAEHVERAVVVGPPNAGAVETLQYLVDGRRFGFLLPRYPAALLGTFPALYQLLPRPRHGALVRAGDPDRPIEDLYDPELWQRMGWGLAATGREAEEVLGQLLPEVPDPAERHRVAMDHLGKSLDRARRFHQALDVPAAPPADLHLYLISGDAVLTSEVAAVDAQGRLEVIRKAPGDGSVLRSSALMDERSGGEWQPTLISPIAWDEVTFLFSDHLGLTKDPMFTDNVLYWLLEDPR